MKLVFSDRAWAHYLHWQEHDAKIVSRLNTLIEQCTRHQFKGTGRPEPLSGNLSGWWSRRIDREHRLVYRVIGKDEAQALEIAQCRFHY